MEELFVNEIEINLFVVTEITYYIWKQKRSHKIIRITKWSLLGIAYLFVPFFIFLSLFGENDHNGAVILSYFILAFIVSLFLFALDGLTKFLFKCRSLRIIRSASQKTVKETYFFTHDRIKLIHSENESMIQEFSYDQIKKMVQTPTLVLMFLETGNIFYIKLDHFTAGDSTHFKQFIGGKCPTAKYSYCKDFKIKRDEKRKK